jgi:hypothetical protein
MALRDIQVRNEKPTDKPRKLADERGLYLLINQVGKYWRFDYRFSNKRKTLALGVYPDVSLALARERQDAARTQLANGIDPGENRKAQKAAAEGRAANSFEAVAREWFAKFSPNWVDSRASKIFLRPPKRSFSMAGRASHCRNHCARNLDMPTPRRTAGRCGNGTSVLQNCGQVFRYAVATGRALRDPWGDLRGALPLVKQRHHPSITDPAEIGRLLRTISGNQVPS